MTFDDKCHDLVLAYLSSDKTVSFEEFVRQYEELLIEAKEELKSHEAIFEFN